MMFWERRGVLPNLKGTLSLVGLTLALSLALLGLITLLFPDLSTIWNGPACYVALLLATLLVVHKIDHMPVDWAGLGIHLWTIRQIGWGTGLGLLMALVAWLPALFIGQIQFSGVEQGDMFLYWMIFLVINSAGEELLFRGYLFQRVAELWGSLVATLLFSGGFALAHLGNPAISSIALLNIFLAGLFFSACYLVTRSLWLPIAAHIVWNVTLMMVLGTPVSGWQFGESLFDTVTSSPVWLTGGSFGPEGGIMTTIALFLGGVLLYLVPAINMAPWSFSRVFWGVYHDKREQI